jgi:hypothetical protein
MHEAKFTGVNAFQTGPSKTYGSTGRSVGRFSVRLVVAWQQDYAAETNLKDPRMLSVELMV